jgi:FAD-dependent oxidoreductase domain-containing protein 1
LDGSLVPCKFQSVVNAAGPWANSISKLAGIGTASKIYELNVPLPVEARKRYIYLFYAEQGPILRLPLTIDHTGVFIRRHGLGNYYLCGLNQKSREEEPDNMELSQIDYDYFEKKIKPVLIERVPSFRDLKLVGAWSGYYEYNTLDQNLIIGPHPIFRNFIFANGSSGHGLQHAAAIGNSVAEMILHGVYKTIDLKRFGFERVLRDEPLKEIDVV